MKLIQTIFSLFSFYLSRSLCRGFLLQHIADYRRQSFNFTFFLPILPSILNGLNAILVNMYPVSNRLIFL